MPVSGRCARELARCGGGRGPRDEPEDDGLVELGVRASWNASG